MLAAYWQSLGILLAQWLPICGLIYLAMRLGVLHGIRAYEAERRLVAARKASPAPFDKALDEIDEPRRRSLAG
jgi:hypothetical protein